MRSKGPTDGPAGVVLVKIGHLARTAALTVEHGHLALVVASACRCAWRHCALDGIQVILAELQLESAELLLRADRVL